MCFSATASFAASGVLAVIGGLTLAKVKHPQDRLFASIPLIFAAQQLIEGLLWITLLRGGSADTQYWLTQSYAAFVGIIWPLMVPASIYLIEPDRFRKRLILGCLTIGAGLALYTLKVIAGTGVNAVIVQQCIQYEGVAAAGTSLLILYIIATSVAFFCSSHRSVNIVGLMNILVFLIAYYSYEINFASGWCFLAAVVSSFIYLHFHGISKLPVIKPVFK
jgi:hypothetical protein